MPGTGAKPRNIKLNTASMSDSNRDELKSRAKDEDNMRFTRRYCLDSWLPLIVAHLYEFHLEATGDHMQDGKNCNSHSLRVISAGFT